MYLILKFLLGLCALLAIVQATDHLRHHRQTDETGSGENEASRNVTDHIIHGRITCRGHGVDYLRPYLHSWRYPETIISISPTSNGGMYKLSTGTMLNTLGSIELSLCHQCHVNSVDPKPYCAVPYYTVRLRFNLIGERTMIKRNLELSDMNYDSTPECLD